MDPLKVVAEVGEKVTERVQDPPGPRILLQLSVCPENPAGRPGSIRKSVISKLPFPVLVKVTSKVLEAPTIVSGKFNVVGTPVADGAGVIARGQNLLTNPVEKP